MLVPSPALPSCLPGVASPYPSRLSSATTSSGVSSVSLVSPICGDDPPPFDSVFVPIIGLYLNLPFTCVSNWGTQLMGCTYTVSKQLPLFKIEIK